MEKKLQQNLLDKYKNELKNLFLFLFSDRHGNNVSHNVLHGVINSFVNVEEYKKKYPLQLYEELFEVPFLKETGDFYRQEAAKLKDQCTCSEYMEKVSEHKNLKKFGHPKKLL